MDNWVYWITTTIIGLMISGLGYFAKKQMADMERSLDKIRQENDRERREAKERLDKVEGKLQATIESMPYQYTLREDFIRAVTGLDAKLDRILDKVGGGN